MSDRAEFEKQFPVPLGVKWCERQQGYTYENYRALDSAANYSGKWQAWQAARAQSGQGVEPEPAAYLLLWPDGSPWGAVNSQSTVEMWMKRADEGRTVRPLYTHLQPAQHPDDAAVDRFAEAMKAKLAKKRAEGRGGWEDPQVCPSGRLQQMLLDHLMKGDPVDIGNFAMMIWNRGEAVAGQPAQQGSVPEGWRECLTEMVQAMHDYEMSVDEDAPYKHRAMMDRAHALLSTTPQPEGDGWIKCSERLPKLGQRVQLFSQGVMQHMMPLFDDSDEGLFWDFEVHDYNPPVDMSRDQWRPLPQPPKEGSGNE